MNDEIRRRFIEDYGLPISIYFDPWFTEMIELQEKYNGAKTKYNNLLKEIGERTPGQFIAQTREIRHEIKDWIEHNEAYKELESDKEISSRFGISKVYPKKEIYKGDMIDKRYISIDLREANFQALRFYDPAIVRDCTSWEEFIGKWSDSNYLKTTKLNRQRLLGKLSPEKQAIIEKYIMSGLHEMFSIRQKGLELISLKTDELIYRVSKDSKIDSILSDAYWVSKSDLGVRVKAESFILRGIQMFTVGGISIFGFYKEFDEGNPKFYGIPKSYLPQFIKKYERREVNNFDLAFLTPTYEEVAQFQYPLQYENSSRL